VSQSSVSRGAPSSPTALEFLRLIAIKNRD